MVSALWKACSEGRLQDVQELLTEATGVDIEVKDHTGVTPLIEAIKNDHSDIVSALLAKGANPTNGSSQAPPEQYTNNPVILEMLRQAMSGFNQLNDNKTLYEPQALYPYYPSSNPPEGAVIYAPQLDSGTVGNLPPPDIARLIPCRFFPACRNGSACLFLHPQTAPFFPAPQQGQYPGPYETMIPQNYPSNYFPGSPPSFQPQQSPMTHGPSSSEMVSPHFNPSGLPAIPYTAMSPLMSPTIYSQVPVVPMTMPPSSALPPGPQSPQIYAMPPPMPQFQQQPEMISPYSPSGAVMPLAYPTMNAGPPISPSQTENFSMIPGRDGSGQIRRGTGRRGPAPRKPPCLFYPAGKCKNGTDCRFPHIIPDGAQMRGPIRPRPNGAVNGFATIDEKLAGLSINGTAHSSRSQSTDPGNRQRFSQGFKGPNGFPNKRPPATKQRVPNADEFPVLAGSTTPPVSDRLTNGNANGFHGVTGPTAAQVLRAPAPFRKESSTDVNCVATPESVKSIQESNVPLANDIAPVVSRLPMSFAAIAGHSEVTNEVSVSA
ncbi:hypothetical protein C8J56DRAFT_918410 [Mycena floridula]|nr:hypothetical protein C8J56DRAFT_918410 [Mycena floridula]